MRLLRGLRDLGTVLVLAVAILGWLVASAAVLGLVWLGVIAPGEPWRGR